MPNPRDPTEPAQSRISKLGEWSVDFGSQRLTRDGSCCVLSPKAWSVLLHLIERAPQAVSRRELIDRTWPDVVVGENVLDQVVAQLRRTLGDDARHPSYIETLPKRGYRLAASVEWASDDGSHQFAEVRADIERTPTIAVLPFQNLELTDEHVGHGVAEEILNRLVGVRQLSVVSRRSSFSDELRGCHIVEVGERLNVRYVLSGSVRRGTDRLRITVVLTDAADGTELWTNSRDCDPTHVLALQDEIARSTVDQLLPNISPTATRIRERVDPTAYDLYLRARDKSRINDLFSAKSLLKSATIIDDSFASAFGALATVLNNLRAWNRFDGEDDLNQTLQKALELDPYNTEALSVEALLTYQQTPDVQRAIVKHESLLRQEPTNLTLLDQYLRILDNCDRPEARLVMERIRRLDTSFARLEFHIHYGAGEFERAEEAVRRIPVTPVGPDVWSGRDAWMLNLEITLGRFDSAAERLSRLYTGNYANPRAHAWFEIWLDVQRGRVDAARRTYEQHLTQVPFTFLPYVWLPLLVVLTGETGPTIDEIAAPRHPASITWIKRLPHRIRWIKQHGAAPCRDAVAALEAEPCFRAALVAHGIDEESLSRLKPATRDVL